MIVKTAGDVFHQQDVEWHKVLDQDDGKQVVKFGLLELGGSATRRLVVKVLLSGDVPQFCGNGKVANSQSQQFLQNFFG